MAKEKKALQELLALDDNKLCADCGIRNPTWASLNLGLFMCIDCSGIHRAMGVHISFVKSTTLDTWKMEWVQSMKRVGNRIANATWEANLPKEKKLSPTASMEERDRWIRAKYESGVWKGKPAASAIQQHPTAVQSAPPTPAATQSVTVPAHATTPQPTGLDIFGGMEMRAHQPSSSPAPLPSSPIPAAQPTSGFAFIGGSAPAAAPVAPHPLDPSLKQTVARHIARRPSVEYLASVNIFHDTDVHQQFEQRANLVAHHLQARRSSQELIDLGIIQETPSGPSGFSFIGSPAPAPASAIRLPSSPAVSSPSSAAPASGFSFIQSSSAAASPVATAPPPPPPSSLNRMNSNGSTSGMAPSPMLNRVNSSGSATGGQAPSGHADLDFFSTPSRARPATGIDLLGAPVSMSSAVGPAAPGSALRGAGLPSIMAPAMTASLDPYAQVFGATGAPSPARTPTVPKSDPFAHIDLGVSAAPAGSTGGRATPGSPMVSATPAAAAAASPSVSGFSFMN